VFVKEDCGGRAKGIRPRTGHMVDLIVDGELLSGYSTHEHYYWCFITTVNCIDAPSECPGQEFIFFTSIGRGSATNRQERVAHSMGHAVWTSHKPTYTPIELSSRACHTYPRVPKRPSATLHTHHPSSIHPSRNPPSTSSARSSATTTAAVCRAAAIAVIVASSGRTKRR
jgi:hypothetical protein